MAAFALRATPWPVETVPFFKEIAAAHTAVRFCYEFLPLRAYAPVYMKKMLGNVLFRNVNEV
jgi:hypothetical protein